jgi:hypothetical protein
LGVLGSGGGGHGHVDGGSAFQVRTTQPLVAGVELVVPVSVTDRHGTEVVHADITTWVMPVG